MPLPPPDCCDSGASGSVTLIAGGGMPGWQIALIAVGAALAAATPPGRAAPTITGRPRGPEPRTASYIASRCA
jgi:hypothetical protein